MNRWKRVLALGAALTMPAVAGSWALGHGTQGRAGEDAQSERELLRLEHDWNTAYQKQDAKALDGLIAADFVFVDGQGKVHDRAGYIDGVVHGAPTTGGISELVVKVINATPKVVT